MNKNEKTMILEDNLWSVMFHISWPAIIAMLLYGLNTFIDGVFVGKFVGEKALAGISLAYPITQLALGIGSLIGVGAGSFLSIELGKGRSINEDKILKNTNTLTLIWAIIYIIFGFFFGQKLFMLMGGKEEVTFYGMKYFNTTLIAAFFWIQGLNYNMIIRAEGRMKKAAIIMGIGLVINIIINYILMGVLGYGVEGAAWGTNIAMLVYTLCGYIYFAKGKASFNAKPLGFLYDKQIIKDINSMGIPSFIMTIMSFIQSIVIYKAVGKIGNDFDIAFVGASTRIFITSLTPLFGLMRAYQPVAGINYGANNYKRVKKSLLIFIFSATVLIMPLYVMSLVKPDFVLSLILPNAQISLEYLNFYRVYISILPLTPIIFIGMTFLPAINKGKPAGIIGICRQVVLYVPVMLIFPNIYGLKAVYYGAFIIDVIITIWVILIIKKEFRLMSEKSNLIMEAT